MLGNVWEWCTDDPRKYSSDPINDPVGSVDSEAQASCQGRMANYPIPFRFCCAGRGRYFLRGKGLDYRGDRTVGRTVKPLKAAHAG
jgi:hypothetical protein